MGIISVNEADIAAFKRLKELGVEVEIQRVPTEAKENIWDLI